MIDLKHCKFTRAQKKEISLGVPIEMEHTKNTSLARRISSQHVCEFNNYYSKGLIPMEKKLKLNILKGGKK